MTKKELLRRIVRIEDEQRELKIPYVALYLVEKERLVPSFGNTTVHHVLRMFSTALMILAEGIGYTPIKILDELGQIMQEQKDEIDRRTKDANKKVIKAAFSAKRS